MLSRHRSQDRSQPKRPTNTNFTFARDFKPKACLRTCDLSKQQTKLSQNSITCQGLDMSTCRVQESLDIALSKHLIKNKQPRKQTSGNPEASMFLSLLIANCLTILIIHKLFQSVSNSISHGLPSGYQLVCLLITHCHQVHDSHLFNGLTTQCCMGYQLVTNWLPIDFPADCCQQLYHSQVFNGLTTQFCMGDALVTHSFTC